MSFTAPLTAGCLLLVIMSAGPAAPGAVKPMPPVRAAAPSAPARSTLTPEEARVTVAMLDDAYQLILHELHDWYPTNDTRPVVAAAIVRQLQERMTKKGWAKSRFLAVDAVLMNPDHRARDNFDKEAAAALKRGAERFEKRDGQSLRVATSVALEGGCLSCHWTGSNKATRAAISWTIPLRPRSPARK